MAIIRLLAVWLLRRPLEKDRRREEKSTRKKGTRRRGRETEKLTNLFVFGAGSRSGCGRGGRKN